jgi:hypothetical protein
MKSMAQQLEVFIFIVDLNKNDDEETGAADAWEAIDSRHHYRQFAEVFPDVNMGLDLCLATN